jgi:3-oxoacyl-[acyl-carrier-protein] synthase II
MTVTAELAPHERRPLRTHHSVAVTSWSAQVPDADLGAIFPGEFGPTGPADAKTVLGRKGLLFKEPATVLAMCAVHRALNLPLGRTVRNSPPDARTAVVASSNFGAVRTVCQVDEATRRGSSRDVSVLDAPNVASNALASSVAIRFGFGGPNLTVCGGPSSGLQAVALGALLIRTRRAGRVVVVGAEPDDEVAARLHERGRPRHPLRAGAACVVLERADEDHRGVVLGSLRPTLRADDRGGGRPAAFVDPPAPFRGLARAIDLYELVGDTHGAHGVLQVAVAASLLRAAHSRGEAPGSVGVTCGEGEEWHSAILRWWPATEDQQQ